MLDARYFATAILILVSYSSAIQAQDILSTTGETVRSYNYVEGFYIANLEDNLPRSAPSDAEIDNPFLIRFSVNLIDNFSLNGKFLNQSYVASSPNTASASADLIVYELGLRYRRELKQVQNTDLIVGAGYGSFEYETNDTRFITTGRTGYYVFYLGGRRTLTDRLELDIGITHEESRNDNTATGETVGEAALVYRMTSRLDVALGAINLSGANNVGLGLRYTWK